MGEQHAATLEAVRALPLRVVQPGEDGEKECAVCLSALLPGEEVRVLTCKHEYHATCLDTWCVPELPRLHGSGRSHRRAAAPCR